MRFLLFLLLGTMIFGLAFPAMIAFIGLFALIIAAFAIIRMFAGGTGFTVYTPRGESRRPHEPEQEAVRRRIYTDKKPGPRGEETRCGYINVAADDEEMAEASEVVELPATALRKDEPDESK